MGFQGQISHPLFLSVQLTCNARCMPDLEKDVTRHSQYNPPPQRQGCPHSSYPSFSETHPNFVAVHGKRRQRTVKELKEKKKDI